MPTRHEMSPLRINRMPKDGRSRGKRTYRCGDRKYRYTPDGSLHFYSSEVIDLTLAMYKEGDDTPLG